MPEFREDPPAGTGTLPFVTALAAASQAGNGRQQTGAAGRSR